MTRNLAETRTFVASYGWDQRLRSLAEHVRLKDKDWTRGAPTRDGQMSVFCQTQTWWKRVWTLVTQAHVGGEGLNRRHLDTRADMCWWLSWAETLRMNIKLTGTPSNRRRVRSLNIPRLKSSSLYKTTAVRACGGNVIFDFLFLPISASVDVRNFCTWF